MSIVKAFLALVLGISVAPASMAAAPHTVSSPTDSPRAVVATTTPVPLVAKVTINDPKIATKKGSSFTLSGRVTGVTLDSGDRLVVRLSRSEGGTWVSRGERVVKRKKIASKTYKWWITFRPTERGKFRAQARLNSHDGRIKPAATRSVVYRVVSPKYVALTFDDGSWRYTDSIRGSLDRAGVKATFFMLGDATKVYKPQARRVTKSGHQIAVHTMSHPDLTRLSNSSIRSQLSRCRTLLKSVTGKTAHWYRPPGGATNSRVRSVARGLGLREMLWTVDTNDWKRPSASTIRSRALRARPGGVVLMHDGGGNRSNTAAAVPGIIKGFKSKGYDLVTLDEWAALQ